MMVSPASGHPAAKARGKANSLLCESSLPTPAASCQVARLNNIFVSVCRRVLSSSVGFTVLKVGSTYAFWLQSPEPRAGPCCWDGSDVCAATARCTALEAKAASIAECTEKETRHLNKKEPVCTIWSSGLIQEVLGVNLPRTR